MQYEEYMTNVADLPSFPYESAATVSLAVPDCGPRNMFTFSDRLTTEQSTALYKKRQAVANALCDSAATCRQRLQAHESYLQALPNDLGRAMVYSWSGGRVQTSMRFEKYNLLHNIAWMYMHLAAASAASDSVAESLANARGLYETAAGVWSAVQAHGFREGELTWPVSKSTSTSTSSSTSTSTSTSTFTSTSRRQAKTPVLLEVSDVGGMRNLALALAQLCILQNLKHKAPQDSAKLSSYHTFSAMVAHRAFDACTLASDGLKRSAALPLVAKYVRILKHCAHAATRLCDATSTLHAGTTLESGIDVDPHNAHHELGISLALARIAQKAANHAQKAVAGQIKPTSTSIFEKFNEIRQDVGGGGGGGSAAGAQKTVAIMQTRYTTHDDFVAYLRARVDKLADIASQRAVALERAVHEYKLQEASETTAKNSCRYTTDLPDKVVAKVQGYPLDTHPLQAPPAQGGSTQQATELGASSRPTHAPPALTHRRELGLRLLQQACEMRVMVQSYIPAQYLPMVIQRENVMRTLLTENTEVSSVIRTLEGHTMPFLNSVKTPAVATYHQTS